jgi:F-type H+-transporting ATPase subunit b
MAWAAEEAHHGGGGLPQFNTATWPSQIFWMAIFFTILYVVFSKSVLPALGGTIQSRADYIADNLQKAEALSAEAESLRAEVDAAFKSAGNQAGTYVTEAETAAKTKLDSALTAFRGRYEDEVSKTEHNIESAKKSAMADMEKIAASLAAQAAEKIAGIPASESGAESVVKSINQKKIAA